MTDNWLHEQYKDVFQTFAHSDGWWVYVIHCSDDSLYTGITNALEQRFQNHASGKGAKYFRGRKPLQVVYLEGGHDRSSASRREVEIKKLSRAEKAALVETGSMDVGSSLA